MTKCLICISQIYVLIEQGYKLGPQSGSNKRPQIGIDTEGPEQPVLASASTWLLAMSVATNWVDVGTVKSSLP